MYINRILNLSDVIQQKSCFLFGPRQTGKSTLVTHLLSEYPMYNLLDSITFLQLSRNPERLGQEIGHARIVIIDEIQRLPSLLSEIHKLIEERGTHFLLTGSSTRKLRSSGVHLLGGRARSRILHPFIYRELDDKFELNKALNIGLIPSIYFSDSPHEDLESYAGDYLREEVAAEGLTRNIPAFSRFLEIAALCNGQMINFTEISNDAQVSRTTVREFFSILTDTLIAYELPAWKKTTVRKATSMSKFYFFDTGIVRSLLNRTTLHSKTPEYGHAFENYIFHELKSYIDYNKTGNLCYWRSTSRFEVDFIFNDHTAIEVKTKTTVSKSDLKGLLAIKEEHLLKNYILISMEDRARTIDGIHILPWRMFLEQLWDHQYA